ncbi:MAG: DUF362 domain-containing protein [Desulfovibrionaceae bacterium]|nr:DUF362 domain-containing protein [Desulfovibrionaceae bacterium]
MASTVYYCSMSCRKHSQTKSAKIAKLCSLLNLNNVVVKGQPCAVKLHFGESGNDTHLNPQLVQVVVDKIRQAGALPFMTDTTTLYSGSRHNAVDHLNTALRHGFAPGVVDAPVIIADGLFGANDLLVTIDAKHFKDVHIATEIVKAPSMVVLSHFKGHEMAGFGGAIKNLAMGCASQRGKRDQHGTTVNVNKEKCIGCGQCVRICPEKAMKIGEDKKSSCDAKKCIGCFECMTVCEPKAIEIDWETDIPSFMERLTEYAYGAVKGWEEHVCYINFVMNVTPDCDCAGWSDTPMIPDVGILASHDPVALDQACYDLVQKQPVLANLDLQGRDLFTARWSYTRGHIQIDYAEELGMGTKEYELKEV